MRYARGSSIGLLLIGIGLVLGSCMPLAQTWWEQPDSGDRIRITLAAGSNAGVIDLAHETRLEPVLVLEPLGEMAGLRYTITIEDPAGRTLLQQEGPPSVDAVDAASPAPSGDPRLSQRLGVVNLPAGRSRARLDTPTPRLIAAAELQLQRSSPALLPALFTALMLALAGWLAAALGALQWVRAAAADPARPPPGPDAANRTAWVVALHLSALLGYLVPMGHVLAPFAVWLARRDSIPDLEAHGRRAMNFQLSVTIYILAALLLSFLLVGLLMLFAVVVLHFSAVVGAALQAQRGRPARYPLSLKFIPED